MPEPKLTEDVKKAAKYGARIGAVLAVLCHLLPPEHRELCSTIVNLCSMHF